MDVAPAVLSREGEKAIELLWGLKLTTFKLLKHSENHTYLVTAQKDESGTQQQRYIVRLTPQDHRSRKAIQAELDFILLLHRSGAAVNVCTPIPLATEVGQFIGETTPYQDHKKFFTVLFKHAHGRGVTDQWLGLRDYGIIAAWGQTLGEMHRAASVKGGNAESWEQMAKDIPDCNQTHGGATDIKTIQSRAEAGHETSQFLLRVWKERIAPFLASCAEPHDSVYGVIHGDLNISNFFAEELSEPEPEEKGTTKRERELTGIGSQGQLLPRIWLFDFDQVHHNWFGFELGVVLQMVQLFVDKNGWGGKPIEGFDPDRFREVFLAAYRAAFPAMVEAGHLEPRMLKGVELYREFYQASVAVDILFQAEAGKRFDTFITSFCQLLVDRFKTVAEREILI
jgi:Ser/Thr protein kinase RdoA (MazF antagonist)